MRATARAVTVPPREDVGTEHLSAVGIRRREIWPQLEDRRVLGQLAKHLLAAWSVLQPSDPALLCGRNREEELAFDAQRLGHFLPQCLGDRFAAGPADDLADDVPSRNGVVADPGSRFPPRL